MKIALCLECPLTQHGGVEVLVSELVRGLGARHEILLVSPDDAASLAKSPASPFVKEHISISPVWDSISNARELAEKITQAKPDIVHFHFGGNYGWGSRAFWNCPVFYFQKSGAPVISTNHGAFSIF
ncbi:MAG TPA: glycosyltransferase family 4 protein, partial [Verrucomicrobiae bacterium]|nr:glycosyltransferase family 4 protein [Verrucomicrobiae bacterium]